MCKVLPVCATNTTSTPICWAPEGLARSLNTSCSAGRPAPQARGRHVHPTSYLRCCGPGMWRTVRALQAGRTPLHIAASGYRPSDTGLEEAAASPGRHGAAHTGGGQRQRPRPSKSSVPPSSTCPAPGRPQGVAAASCTHWVGLLNAAVHGRGAGAHRADRFVSNLPQLLSLFRKSTAQRPATHHLRGCCCRMATRLCTSLLRTRASRPRPSSGCCCSRGWSWTHGTRYAGGGTGGVGGRGGSASCYLSPVHSRGRRRPARTGTYTHARQRYALRGLLACHMAHCGSGAVTRRSRAHPLRCARRRACPPARWLWRRATRRRPGPCTTRGPTWRTRM